MEKTLEKLQKIENLQKQIKGLELELNTLENDLDFINIDGVTWYNKEYIKEEGWYYFLDEDFSDCFNDYYYENEDIHCNEQLLEYIERSYDDIWVYEPHPTIKNYYKPLEHQKGKELIVSLIKKEIENTYKYFMKHLDKLK